MKYNDTTLVQGVSENFLIMYTNADSLPNTVQELKTLINNTSPKPKVIALTEVKHKSKWNVALTHTHTHTHLFNSPLSRTTPVHQYQKGKTNLDFTEARDSEWQWHQLVHMQVCILLQTDNHANTSPLKFFSGRMPSCRPTNSVKALKAWNAALSEFNIPGYNIYSNNLLVLITEVL